MGYFGVVGAEGITTFILFHSFVDSTDTHHTYLTLINTHWSILVLRISIHTVKLQILLEQTYLCPVRNLDFASIHVTVYNTLLLVPASVNCCYYVFTEVISFGTCDCVVARRTSARL
jgi:hypothetical protein